MFIDVIFMKLSLWLNSVPPKFENFTLIAGGQKLHFAEFVLSSKAITKQNDFPSLNHQGKGSADHRNEHKRIRHN